MHAFDFILMLFSFVYAAAVTHVLSTVGEIIIRHSGGRHQVSIEPAPPHTSL
jgi:hypothetical protein